MKPLGVALLLASIGSVSFAVEPEECLVPPGAAAAATVEHGGRTYELASVECRELFLSDPERYSQLFDALAELGVRADPEPPGEASLVPN